MGKILIDVQCVKCEYVTKDVWASSELREAISKGEELCSKCSTPVSILLGAPQFKLNRGCGGFYDPGKH